MKHTICYPGLLNVSLGVMQEGYMETYLPWPNKRVGVEGTLQGPPYTLASGIEWVRNLEKQKDSHHVFAILMHTGTANEEPTS